MQTSLIAWAIDPCYYESSHGDAHHAGELENGAPELPGGRFRPGGRQVAGDPYRSAAGLCGWCYHRVYSFGRAHFGRIGGAAFTAGFGHVLNDFFTAITKPGATLTVALYFYAKEDGEFGVAFAIASILVR